MQIRRSATALLLAAVIAVGGLSACSSGADAITAVTPADAVAVIAKPGVAVLDVRTPDEFATGHLAGAVNIDIEGQTFDQQVADLPKDATYVVYCRSGNRSGVATKKLADLGFTDVYDVQGGIVAWQAAGGPVVTD
ncbi:MAG: rhodanese-like domain-containing protein [Cellulomonas sp.]